MSDVGGLVQLLRLLSAPPFGLLLGCLLWMKVEVPSRWKFKGFGKFMMSVSSFVSRQDALLLDDYLDARDVSR